MQFTFYWSEAINQGRLIASEYYNEFFTPEHILYALTEQEPFCTALEYLGTDPNKLAADLERYIDEKIEKMPDEAEFETEPSMQTMALVQEAFQIAGKSNRDIADVPHLIQALMNLKESNAAFFLLTLIQNKKEDFLAELHAQYNPLTDNLSADSDDFLVRPVSNMDRGESPQEENSWKNLLVCMNDQVESHNPLIGREDELERTIRVLCRKDKNNPLHVGEAGVGKTAIAYGLAAMIEKGQVPERLKNCRIYELNLGGLVAGTQYRGEFEQRLKNIMNGIRKEGNAIIYIDEFHNIVGAGSVNGNSMDASNLLKPYMESGEIRFMGATTYEEFNRNLANSKGLMRRFQQIDILEPSVDETIKIIEGLKEHYENYHKVVYDEGVIEYAVRNSAKFINDRFLPDKAIDLIDEAGAYREIHPSEDGTNHVDCSLIKQILARICKVENLMVEKKDENEHLIHLPEKIKQRIYGQEEATKAVAEAIQMAKAGLTDDNKPIASLLFVGPTGVGKTELAKVLADEMDLPLIRFDMSEYTEKQTVAKLIGSPAGYVGYEDGGLLTDAIRKTPHCVLLLDEIEKAHPDIFNVLLQVMDYAVLTDNKGIKSDCRHLVLIMTSNAGAQFSHQASIGFGGTVEAGVAMMKQVKRTFKPEFLNRLSDTIVFHDMNESMATLILKKKLDELNGKLAAKNIRMTVSTEAEKWLLKKGITQEYGAREMDRVLAKQLKPMLMRALLKKELQAGDRILVDLKEDALCYVIHDQNSIGNNK